MPFKKGNTYKRLNTQPKKPKGPINIQKIVTKVPKTNALWTYDLKVRDEVVRLILSDLSLHEINAKMVQLGRSDLTVDQLARLKRSLRPLYLEETAYGTFFKHYEHDVKPKLKKLEFLVNQEYERIVELMEEEFADRDILELTTTADKLPPGVGNIQAMLKSYYEGTISPEDKKILQTFSRKKKGRSDLPKRISGFFNLVEKYTDIRKIMYNMQKAEKKLANEDAENSETSENPKPVMPIFGPAITDAEFTTDEEKLDGQIEVEETEENPE